MFTPNDMDNNTPGGLEGAHAPGLLGELWDWCKSILIALTLVVAVHQFGFHLSTVKGSSMLPTLEEGEWLFINKTARFIGSPRHGDVIIIKDEDADNSAHPYLVKRIVGLPGDKVEVRLGELYVNDVRQVEAYTDSPIEENRFAPVTVEPDHYFVMGDNRHRGASYDSRSFGPVAASQIEGKAEWIVWPLAKLRGL